MKRIMRLVTSLAAVAVSVAAQPQPNFSGRWQLVPDSGGAGNTARSAPTLGPGWGPEISIAQDASTLAIEFTTYVRYDMQPPTRLVYRLDGSDSRNTMNTGRGPQEQSATAAWDAAKLTITTTRTFSAGQGDKPAHIKTTQVLSLESPATLVVETTHDGALGGKPSTSRSIYKKS